jgi:O-methyltransferase involved in polyketide biosynthesis
MYTSEEKATKVAEIQQKLETLKNTKSSPTDTKLSSAVKRDIAALQAELAKIQAEIHTNRYHLLAGDLRKLDVLRKRLAELGVDFNRPTLLFAECVMTYMLASDSSELIKWAQQTFPCAVFMAYEQVNPHVRPPVEYASDFRTRHF